MNAVEETRMIGQILDRLLPQLNAQVQELTQEQRRLIMHVCIGVLAEAQKESHARILELEETNHRLRVRLDLLCTMASSED